MSKENEMGNASFSEITELIQSARQRAYRAVNTELVNLYWQVGEYISGKIASAEWGEGVVEELARYLAETQPRLRGFTRANLFRMRKFHDTYVDDEKVSAVLTQLPWTHHLLILSQAKQPEEREFYVRMAIREKWSKRELDRQLKSGLFLRIVVNPPKVAPLVRQLYPLAEEVFKDVYSLEFLGLSNGEPVARCIAGVSPALFRATGAVRAGGTPAVPAGAIS